MTVELTLTLNDDVYAKVQRLAARRQAAVSEVVADVLDDLLRTNDEAEGADWAEPDEAVEREVEAYHAMHAMLWAKYPGEHVALYNGRLIDHDVDGLALSQRIYQRYPDHFVLIRQVKAEPDPILLFRSPRIAESV